MRCKSPLSSRQLLNLAAVLPCICMAHVRAAAAAVELSSTIVLFYTSELQPRSDTEMSQCELLLRRAQKHGGRRIQFVPTHYWYDANTASQDPNVCYPDNWADTNLKVDYYCTKADWNSDCGPFTAEAVAAFKDGMQQCLTVAVQLYNLVLLAPHLDPAMGTSKRGKWRNMLKFDPLQKDQYGYRQWASFKFVLKCDGANAAFGDRTDSTLQFAMGGEMGGTLLNHPAEYLTIFNYIHSNWTSSSQLELGVVFYHAYIPGQIIHGPGPYSPLPESALGALDGGYGPLLPFEQWPGVERLQAVLPDTKRLIQAADFVGVSNYARAPATVQPSDIESSTAKLMAEFQAMGIDFNSQLAAGKKHMERVWFGRWPLRLW